MGVDCEASVTCDRECLTGVVTEKPDSYTDWYVDWVLYFYVDEIFELLSAKKGL